MTRTSSFLPCSAETGDAFIQRAPISLLMFVQDLQASQPSSAENDDVYASSGSVYAATSFALTSLNRSEDQLSLEDASSTGLAAELKAWDAASDEVWERIDDEN